MSEITYCATAGHNTHQTDTPSRLCRHCEHQLNDWLNTIPDLYTLLPTFIEHGTTEGNPESKATKKATVSAPMRLEIIDLLDTRYGRKWNGTEPTDDRRGVLGTLMAICSEIIDGRNLTIPPKPTVTQTAAFIRRHLEWAREQDWIGDTHAEIKQLHRALSDAIGEYRRPPVGKCHITDDEDTPCGGGLHANTYGGVRCGRCGATWDAAHLRQLGLAQATQ